MSPSPLEEIKRRKRWQGGRGGYEASNASKTKSARSRVKKGFVKDSNEPRSICKGQKGRLRAKAKTWPEGEDMTST
jgi:hypothetical protein